MARRLDRDGPRVKVVRVDARALPAVIEVEDRYRDVLLLVWAGDRFLGRLTVAGARRLPAAAIAPLIRERFAYEQWQARVSERLTGGDAARPNPTVSVVVATRNRTDHLRVCLDALLRLDPAPDEILVVDNAPSDDRTRELCAQYPVRYVLEPTPGASRAHNRGIQETTGDLIAFTDDDVVPDEHWLRGLGDSFDDPLVAAVTGYVAPLQIESRAQYLFERQGGFDRGSERRMFDGRHVPPAVAAMQVGATANVVIRRSALARYGVFSEDLGCGVLVDGADESELFYRLLAARLRLVHEPSRLVWHNHRASMEELAKLQQTYSVAVVAFCLRLLGRYRDPSALGLLWWWATRRMAGDLLRTLLRREDALPLRNVYMQIRGAAVAPLRLVRSRRSRRSIPPVPPPQLPPVPAAAIRVTAESPLLSVVIPSHNRRERLTEILETLATGSYPAVRFEVVAALDRCSDDSRAAVEALPLPYPLTVVESDNGSAGPTRNDGVMRSREATLVFLDDDIVPDPQFLAAHADAHRHGRDVVALGYCPPVVSNGWWAQETRNWWEDHYRGQREPNHQWTFVDFAVGNASLSRELLDRCGGFDPTFPGPRGREDWELGIRILDAGGRLRFVAAARGDHYLDESFETALRNSRSDARSELEVARRHPQAIGHLSIVNVAAAVARGDRRVLNAYRHPGQGQAVADIGGRTLPVLEHLSMRKSWRWLAFALLRHAFVAGLVEALPGEDALLELVGGWRHELPTLEYELGGAFSAVAPPTAAADLVITSGGQSLAALSPVEPGQQWQWADVLQRVAAHSHLVQEAEVYAQLAALAGLEAGS
jgi:GT2 family glycosyltransferase